MSEPARVFLFQPYYADVNAGSARAFWGMPCRPSRGAGVVVGATALSNSLLARGFNLGLCEAMVRRDLPKDDPERVTHFAMLHADIEPQYMEWVDCLLEQMAANHLQVVSTVVPIKQPGGDTSTAIGDRHDEWTARRCIKLGERESLPETFTLRHVTQDFANDVLLVNTGCWVADLRHPFWNTFAFTIKDRIVRKPDGTRDVQCLPEDWHWSREMDKAGIRYGATFALPVIHHGGGRFANH